MVEHAIKITAPVKMDSLESSVSHPFARNSVSTEVAVFYLTSAYALMGSLDTAVSKVKIYWVFTIYKNFGKFPLGISSREERVPSFPALLLLLLLLFFFFLNVSQKFSLRVLQPLIAVEFTKFR
ncbi:uncharacterized protein LOC144666632 [Oculina patagonica]